MLFRTSILSLLLVLLWGMTAAVHPCEANNLGHEPVIAAISAVHPAQQPRAVGARRRQQPFHGLGDLQPSARRGQLANDVRLGPQRRNPGRATNALLLESAASLWQRHTLLGRVERLENDELIGNGQVAVVEKLSLGYIYDVLHASPLRAGVGVLGSLSRVPEDLVPRYGSRNLSSFMVFLRLRLAGHSMDSTDSMDSSMKM
jgi:hypothetical protein